MSITGAHALLHTSDPEAVRSVLRDVLGWKNVDAGGGWLIFALPPAEVAVHPSDTPHHELSLICDDLDMTIADLRARGIEFRGEPHTERWGHAVTMVLPGDVEVMLYQPLHPTVI
jgi:hypothetical protein